MRFLLFFLFLFFSTNSIADDSSKAKNNIITNLTNSISSALENAIGGEGDTEVQITAGEEYHPEYSIMVVRPIVTHPGVDTLFVQLQLNDTKVRGKGRINVNAGLGYRKLSENKKSFAGANTFLDYDEEGNARVSIGLELRASAFEAILNAYQGISGAQTVGSYTERSLDGLEVSVVGEVPFFPWAKVVINSYEWQAEKNATNSQGEKYSLELTLHPNFIVEGGVNDNNNNGSTNFVKAYMVFPARDRVAATTDFVSRSPFSSGDVSGDLLSKVRRSNKQAIESEGTGVVMARVN